MMQTGRSVALLGGWRWDARRELVKLVKIVVALDGSRGAEAALPKAGRRRDHRGCRTRRET